MMTLTGDLGLGNSVNDRDKLEATLEQSGLTRAGSRFSIDEVGHTRSGDDIVSFFVLGNYSRFNLSVYYSPSSGALKFLGRERSFEGFSLEVQDCISKIASRSKEVFGDKIKIKTEETSAILL